MNLGDFQVDHNGRLFLGKCYIANYLLESGVSHVFLLSGKVIIGKCSIVKYLLESGDFQVDHVGGYL